MRLKLSDPLATSIRAYSSLDIVAVRVESEEGAVGWGEARECTHITGETQSVIVDVVENRLASAIEGLDPFDLAETHARMNREISHNTAAKSAVDIALHDLAGQLAGQPVSRILGGAPRGPVSSSKAVSVGATAAMVAQATDFVAAGFRTLKIKTGLDASAERTAIAEIRKAVGPEVRLKLDANQAWLLSDATRFLQAVERYDIEVVEQPLPAWDLTGHAELRRRTPIPVMLDESVHSSRDALQAIEMNAADCINIKLIKTGGLAPAKKVLAVCEAGDVPCQVGTLDSSIGSAAALHLVHANPIIRYSEINGPNRLEVDVARGFKVENGDASVASGPGLGVQVDLAAMEGMGT